MIPASCHDLLTPRLHLRPLTPSDRHAFLSLESASRDFFSLYSPGQDPAESPDHFFDRHLARSADGLLSGTALRRGAFLRSTGELIGHFNLSDLVRGVSHRCNLGWRVHALHARHGYAYEALTHLLTQIFTPTDLGGLGLHRAECAIQPANTPSLRLAEKLGFRIEGFALRYLKIAGDWRDHYLLAKLADEHLSP